VEDAARAIIAATEQYDQPEPVNLGSGQEVSIKYLVETVAALTGFTGSIFWDITEPNGQPRRCLDVTRAQQSFGFKAGTDLDAGLRRTLEWYLASRQNQSSEPSSEQLQTATAR